MVKQTTFLSESRVCVVGSQRQSELCATRKHPVRLVSALRCQIIDQHSDVALRAVYRQLVSLQHLTTRQEVVIVFIPNKKSIKCLSKYTMFQEVEQPLPLSKLTTYLFTFYSLPHFKG